VVSVWYQQGERVRQKPAICKTGTKSQGDLNLSVNLGQGLGAG